VLLRTGDTPRALAAFQQAVELKPAFIDARDQLASMLVNANQWQAAAGQFEEILRLRPGRLETRYRLVEVLQHLGDHQGVVRELSQCLLLDPDNAASHYNLGVALALGTGDRERAAVEFHRALALKPDYEDARKALAAVR
jgi:tetratricopeptide (TPR) repeat protein